MKLTPVKAILARKQPWRASISQRTLGRLCVALVIAMLIPLVVIALYNYPADDDFTTAFPPTQAWLETGSLVKVAKAIVDLTTDTYLNWQGNFVSTALFSCSPIIFGVDWYFLTSWFLLALLCLSIGYLVKGVTGGLLRAGRWAFWIVYTAVLVLALQFMPAIGYSIFWYNGGLYTAAACTLFLLEGVLCRALGAQTRRRALWRGFCAALLGFLLGGSFFGPMLGAFVLVLLQTLTAFVKKSKNRAACALALGFFTLSLIISVTAPGNLLRQERTGEALSPVAAVVTAVLDSFDLAGQWLTPQLLAALMLIAPVLWRPLRQSRFSFKHPLLTLTALYGLFSAALVPGVFTGFGYTTERYINVIYFYFLFMVIGAAIYALGALIRGLEHSAAPWARQLLDACDGLGRRFAAWYLALCLGLTAFGGFGYTMMNTASLSAARSLITGEAAQFRADMAERQAYILNTDSDETQIAPLGGQPYVFKEDKLPWQGIYGRVRYMKWYFEAFERAKGQ